MYERKCKVCGEPFQTRTYRKEKCKPDCGRKRGAHPGDEIRRIQRENYEVEFIGVDGEGINTRELLEFFNEDEGEIQLRWEAVHHYVLLSVGDKSLHKNGEPLTHEDIFTFLWEQFEANPNSIFVGFFLGYDFTMWLKTIDKDAAWELLSKEGISRRQPDPDSGRVMTYPVRDGYWGREVNGIRGHYAKWEFDILPPARRFKLRPYVHPAEVPMRFVKHKDGTVTSERIPRPWMYINDAGPFFQCSFLKAINPKDWKTPILSDEEYETIQRGKERRSDANFDLEMIQYNVLENEIMSRLMSKLNEGFVGDNIRLRKDQWFGPGQAAQAWMKNIMVPTGEEVRQAVPKYAREAARKSYYGGWFEIFAHGLIPGTSYAYDINSAYPHIIAELPCLLHGEWTHGKGRAPRKQPKSLRLLYVTLRGNDMYVGPAPHREADGSILRPHKTKGWYWHHELMAAKRAGLITEMVTHEWVDYEPCKCDPPMASIRDLYQGRLEVGKNSPYGIAKKLIYNSSYGKLAQSAGSPKFSNPVWASLITAGCRTMILDCIATHPTKSASLLMIATDGIVFREPHPNLKIHKSELGAWDADQYQNLSLFMPGLYWHDEAREAIKAGDAPKLKSRGVNAKHLATMIDRVDMQWARINQPIPNHPGELYGVPKVSLPIPWALTTAKQAVTRSNWWSCGQVLYDEERWINADPSSKRYGMHRQKATGLIRTFPYDIGVQLETVYYDRGFGEPMDDADDIGQMVTPDGTVGSVQAWAFQSR